MRTVLGEAGIRKVLPNHQGIRVNKDGWGKEYLWAVRDPDRLHGMTERELAAEFLKERAALPPNFQQQYGPPQQQSPKFAKQSPRKQGSASEKKSTRPSRQSRTPGARKPKGK